MTSEICGITPDACTFRQKISAKPASETTPSWMRAPPESLMPITGQPILAARSMTLTIFSPITSPSEPPKTVKSWLNTHTRRPSMVPWPVTTASPHGRFLSSPKSWTRWRTKVSSSWKDPGSRSFSIRSRAVYLPLACCFSTAFSEAWSTTAVRSSSSCSSRSANVSGAFCRICPRTIPRLPSPPDLRAVAARLDLEGPVLEPHRGWRQELDLGSILPEDLAQRSAHLADAGLGLQRLADRREQVVRGLGRPHERGQALPRELGVAVGLERLQALDLGLLGRGIDG